MPASNEQAVSAASAGAVSDIPPELSAASAKERPPDSADEPSGAQPGSTASGAGSEQASVSPPVAESIAAEGTGDFPSVGQTIEDEAALPASGLTGTPEDALASFVDAWTWLVDGGPVLMVIAVLSVIALTLVLLKTWQFYRLRLDAREPVARALRLWAEGESTAAVAEVADSPQPVALVLHRALTGYLQAGVVVERLREELVRVANEELEKLRSYLRALETIATLSPLLGLLGTVLGMIEAFRQLEQAGARVDPALLSGGIWQALLTTAAGLGVAIPVVFAHAWLERRVETCGHRMEDAVTRVFTRDMAVPPVPERLSAAASVAIPSAEIGNRPNAA